MSPVKEPGYFATEIRAENLSGPLRRHLAVQSRALPKILNDGAPFNPYGWLAGDWQDYERLFQGVNGEKAIGEATAAYLWSATAAANIRARLPEARIIMILRDPAERAFSQYLHQLSVGLTGATFREHLEQCARSGRKKLSPLYPFLEIGLYCDQVKRFLDLFPREQIRIYWYEEAWRQPANLLADMFAFLDVDDTFQPDLSGKSLQRRAPRLVAPHHFLKKFGLWYPLKALVPARLRAPLRQLAFRRAPLAGHGPGRSPLPHRLLSRRHSAPRSPARSRPHRLAYIEGAHAPLARGIVGDAQTFPERDRLRSVQRPRPA